MPIQATRLNEEITVQVETIDREPPVTATTASTTEEPVIIRGSASAVLCWRTPAKADTTVWLATARPELLGTGKFWHDPRTRREYLVAKPLAQQNALARELWDRLAGMTHASTG